jgi:hypothetical protein
MNERVKTNAKKDEARRVERDEGPVDPQEVFFVASEKFM